MSAEKALEANRDQLMTVQGVVGVGLGLQQGEKVIVVMCELPAAEMQARLPTRVENVRVIVQETGPVRAY